MFAQQAGRRGFQPVVRTVKRVSALRLGAVRIALARLRAAAAPTSTSASAADP
jgi:hypothetical protein